MYAPLYTESSALERMSANPFLDRLQNHVSSLGTHPIPTYTEHVPGMHAGPRPSAYSTAYGTDRMAWAPSVAGPQTFGTVDRGGGSPSGSSRAWLWFFLIGLFVLGAWGFLIWTERRKDAASRTSREGYAPYERSVRETDELRGARACGDLDGVPTDPLWDAWTRPM